MVKCNPCLGAQPIHMNLKPILQDYPAYYEQLQHDSLELKRLLAKNKIPKSKTEEVKEDKVHSDLLASDAARRKLKLTDLASKPKCQYGPQDSLNKPSVSVKQPSKKCASPAKRSRYEENSLCNC